MNVASYRALSEPISDLASMINQRRIARQLKADKAEEFTKEAKLRKELLKEQNDNALKLEAMKSGGRFDKTKYKEVVSYDPETGERTTRWEAIGAAGTPSVGAGAGTGGVADDVGGADVDPFGGFKANDKLSGKSPVSSSRQSAIDVFREARGIPTNSISAGQQQVGQSAPNKIDAMIQALRSQQSPVGGQPTMTPEEIQQLEEDKKMQEFLLKQKQASVAGV